MVRTVASPLGDPVAHGVAVNVEQVRGLRHRVAAMQLDAAEVRAPVRAAHGLLAVEQAAHGRHLHQRAGGRA